MGGYKLIKGSKNVKIENYIFVELLSFSFSGKNSQDYKIQVESKSTVINALKKRKPVKILFFSSHSKLKTVNIILLDTFPGVTDAFPDASVGYYRSEKYCHCQSFWKII